ncbi:MAG: hypothetical protein GF353_06670, partial [Candidatus Lokiarchaeota archaeon]|nr:hypothetical protein [Candidatus Lokiarchaeota archaeon]
MNTISPSKNLEIIEKIGNIIYEDKVDFIIILLLTVFKELKLSKLAKYSKMSKTTISRHIKSINRNFKNLIKFRESKVRGNIPAKIYRIESEVRQKLMSMDVDAQVLYNHPNLKSFLPMLLSLNRITVFIMQNIHKTLNSFFDFLELDIEKSNKKEKDSIYSKIVRSMPNYEATYNKHLVFLTETQKNKIIPVYRNFIDEMLKILQEPTLEDNQPY